MSGTGTRAATTTATFAEQVNRTTRNVKTDLLEIVDTYRQIDYTEANKYIADFRALMYERFLAEVELYWVRRGSDYVIGGYKYTVSNGEAVRVLDRAGGIAYESAKAIADFKIIIRYTAAWRNLSDSERRVFTGGLQIPWTTVANPNYSGGSYAAADRSYGQAAVGISRQEFKQS